jgi:hypothetical protein
MIDAGFVTETREEKSRSNINKKFYSWVEKDTEEKKESQPYSEEHWRKRINTLRSFAVLNQSFLKNWIELLDSLEQKMNNGNYEEAVSIFKNLDSSVEGTRLFHSVAFYTPDNAALFYNRIKKLYDEIPDEIESKSDENPYYGGLMVLPIRKILDYVYPIEKEQ